MTSEQAELRDAFAIEGGEMLAEMESALLALGTKVDDAEGHALLFRTIHTIKGSAGIVSFEPLERFCHGIESVLVRVREGELLPGPPFIEILLECHDRIRGMMTRFRDGDEGDASAPGDARLLDRLTAWRPSSNPVAPVVAGEDDHSSPDVENRADAGDFRDHRAVRVDSVKLDQMSDLIVELVTASSVLETAVRRLGDASTSESASRVAELVKQIQEKSMVFRMVPVQTLFGRFRRIVHDIGRSSGKEIRLHVVGGETELDKAVAEKLYEPILHMVRNAVDHGIEPMEERAAAGKPRVGTIRLEAHHEAGNIVIQVGDDGGGIRLGAVARKASEMGLARREESAPGLDLIKHIFEPGFSTLEEATLLSGRGVGMDVARKAVESLRGRIEVDTKEGAGATFRISIPLSLSVVDGLMVSLGDNLYIFPMERVLETLEMPEEALRNGRFKLREGLLPCLDLRALLGVSDQPSTVRHVVVVRHGEGSVGFIVDRLLGEIKAAVKPVGRLFGGVTGISGTSILGDGGIALFLETGKLIDSSVDLGRVGR